MFSQKSKHVLFGLIAFVALLTTFFMQQNSPEYLVSAERGTVKGVSSNAIAQATQIEVIGQCLDVITMGYNPKTGVCQQFSNNCLPDGWERDCPINPTDTVLPTNEVGKITNIPVPTTSSTCPLQPKGDADCNQVINDIDYERWRTAFKGQPLQGLNVNPDFDNNQRYDLLDFEIWRMNRFKSGVVIPTVMPTCVPLPSCVNDPVNPCAVRPPFAGYYCDTSLSPSVQPSPTSQPGNVTVTPTSVATISCAECGYLSLKEAENTCNGLGCVGMQSCQPVKLSCTKGSSTNPNCYQARCVNTSDL